MERKELSGEELKKLDAIINEIQSGKILDEKEVNFWHTNARRLSSLALRLSTSGLLPEQLTVFSTPQQYINFIRANFPYKKLTLRLTPELTVSGRSIQHLPGGLIAPPQFPSGPITSAGVGRGVPVIITGGGRGVPIVTTGGRGVPITTTGGRGVPITTTGGRGRGIPIPVTPSTAGGRGKTLQFTVGKKTAIPTKETIRPINVRSSIKSGRSVRSLFSERPGGPSVSIPEPSLLERSAMLRASEEAKEKTMERRAMTIKKKQREQKSVRERLTDIMRKRGPISVLKTPRTNIVPISQPVGEEVKAGTGIPEPFEVEPRIYKKPYESISGEEEEEKSETVKPGTRNIYTEYEDEEPISY